MHRYISVRSSGKPGTQPACQSAALAAEELAHWVAGPHLGTGPHHSSGTVHSMSGGIGTVKCDLSLCRGKHENI